MSARLDNTAEHIADDEIGPVTYDVKRILLPTDGSATAIEATEVAVGIAKRFGAELVAIFVDPAPAFDPLEESMLEASEGVHHTRAGLHVAEVSGKKNGVSVRSVIEVGATAHAILDTAREQECDLIVIGNTGRTGLKRLMLGSVAEAVVRDAEVPVLVIKACSTKYCTAVRTDS
jgi:nucleotide-binding universal stress UspA family protein